MFTKTIRERSGNKTIFCYDKVPENQSEEMQVVFNTCLKIANDFIGYVYSIYKPVFDKITKPNVYLCFDPNDVSLINAFTDGSDIFVYGAAFIGMGSYITERLSTDNTDGSKIFIAGMEDASIMKIREYLIEVIVAHELIHIWHSHGVWKRTVLPISETDHDEAVLFDEITDISEDNSSSTFPMMSDDLFGALSSNQKNLIQQVLEIDSDCGAINLVIKKIIDDAAPIVREAAQEQGEEKQRKLDFSIFYQRKLIGFLVAASGLMCGFFDREIFKGDYFRSLNCLDSFSHPLPSIRFYKMKLTINTVLYTIFDEEQIVSELLADDYTFRTEIFSHDEDGNKDTRNCFWAPVFTKEAQEHIVKLEEGWNTIHDTVALFSKMAVPEKFSAESMIIPEGNILFDRTGRWIS